MLIILQCYITGVVLHSTRDSFIENNVVGFSHQMDDESFYGYF